jgi:hypothetical protein
MQKRTPLSDATTVKVPKGALTVPRNISIGVFVAATYLDYTTTTD